MVLPQVPEADERSLDQVVIENVALDGLHGLRALDIEVGVGGELASPLSDSVNLLFDVDFAVFLRSCHRCLHLCNSVANYSCEDIVAEFTHQYRSGEVHMRRVRSVSKTGADRAVKNVAEGDVYFELFLHLGTGRHEGLQGEKQWCDHADIRATILFIECNQVS